MKVCENCGFRGEDYVFLKTKGKCPVCYPEERKKFIARKKFKEENAAEEPIPVDLI